MGAFFRLTRPLNLLIIVFTMVAMRYGLVQAFLDLSTADLLSMTTMPGATIFPHIPGNVFVHAFGELPFWTLVLSTVLIAAGGNVINDYFDTRIDRVNRPGTVIVGRSVKRRMAMMGHMILTGGGVLLGVAVAWRSGQWPLAAIPVFSAASLWYYSTKFKRTFLLGNGLVALLVALVPLTVGLYEIPALGRSYGGTMQGNLPGGEVVELVFHFDGLRWWFLGFSGFAFLSTLVRELQKDMADIRGDQADGCRTVPIVLGMKWAKAMTLFYLALTVSGLLLVRAIALRDQFSYWYIGAGIVLPMLVSAGFTYGAHDRRGFNTAGHLLKAAMAIAVAFAFFLHKVL